MDSNFKVKVSADLGELESSIKNVQGLLSGIGANASKSGSTITNATKQASDATRNLSTSLKDMEANANRGRMVAFAFGQVIRDAGFFSQSFGLGLLAISNNIPLLVDQLIQMANVTGKAASALSLAGSLLTAALTIYAYYAQSVKDSNAEYVKSMAEAEKSARANIATINSLVSVAKDESLSYRDRNQAIKELNKQYPELNNQLTVNNINSEKSIELLGRLTKATELHAKAQALAKLIGEQYESQFKAINNSVDSQASLVAKAGSVILQAFGQNAQAALLKTSSGIEQFSKTMGSTQQNAQKYQTELNKINAELANLGMLHTDNQKKGKGVADVYKELSIALKQASSDLTGTFGDQARSKVDAYQKAIDDLIKLGISPLDQRIKNLQSKQISLDFDANGIKTAKAEISSFAAVTTQSIDKVNTTNLIPFEKSIQKMNDVVAKSKTDFRLQMEEFATSVRDILVNGLSSTLSDTAEAIGSAIATGGNVAQAAGQALLQNLGNILSQLGQLAISTGLAIAGIKKALQSLNPAVAIAAGIALMALAGFVKGKAASMGNSMGGGGGGGSESKSSGSKMSVIPFANGGIVSGPTPALVGEYPGARSNPEVIAPLDKLQGIIAGSAGGGMMTGTLETRISGNDLVILMNRATKNRNSYY